MKKRKNQSQEIVRLFEQLFNQNNISGIINIPSIGTMSLYTSEIGKKKVLDYSKMELTAEEIIRTRQAENLIMSGKLDSDTHPIIKSKTPLYVG